VGIRYLVLLLLGFYGTLVLQGYGAMASIKMIASIIASDVKNKFAIYSHS
jgi:hypothetical protein